VDTLAEKDRTVCTCFHRSGVVMFALSRDPHASRPLPQPRSDAEMVFGGWGPSAAIALGGSSRDTKAQRGAAAPVTLPSSQPNTKGTRRLFVPVRTNSLRNGHDARRAPTFLTRRLSGGLVSAHDFDPSWIRRVGGFGMNCPRCQTENPAHAKFCLACGVPFKGTKDDGARGIPYVELERALTEAREQQTATSDILSVISSAPNDLDRVLDAVATRTRQGCRQRVH